MELGPTCPHRPPSSHDMGASRRPAAAWFCVSTEKPGTAGDAGGRPVRQGPKDGVPQSRHTAVTAEPNRRAGQALAASCWGPGWFCGFWADPGGSATGNPRPREPSSRNLSPGIMLLEKAVNLLLPGGPALSVSPVTSAGETVSLTRRA